MKEIFIKKFFSNARLNIVEECRALGWGFWQCPPFLVAMLGAVTIVMMVITYAISARVVEEPQIAALIVMLITVLFLTIGNLIITGFNRVAEANRMKTEFISTLSHQLRSPLSIFKWTLDMIEQIETKDSQDHPSSDAHAQIQNFIKTLRNTTDAMVHLVNSLLEASRIEGRAMVLKKEVFSLRDLTEQIVRVFEKYAEGMNKKIETRFDPALPPIYADKDRVSMVIENLVDNALRYSEPEKVIIISVAQNNGSLLWSIQDAGVGIPFKQQKYIFQKFFRATNARNLKIHGSGIGLYVARAVIEASGGKIGFESSEGKGSRFWFTLPV